MSEIVSRPYIPKMACEKCVFGSGQHADWCEALIVPWTVVLEGDSLLLWQKLHLGKLPGNSA